MIDKEPFGRDQNATTLLDNLWDMSVNYKQLINAKFEFDDTNSPEINKALRALNESLFVLNRINSSSRILTLELLFPEPSFSILECSEIVGLVERLTISWQVAGENAQQLEDVFQNLAHKIHIGAISRKEVVQSLIELFPEEERIKSELEGPIADATMARVIIYRIHQYLGDVDRIIPYATDATEVEHVAPQSATPEWLSALGLTESPEDLAEYESLVEVIGNKVLLEQTINNTLKQRGFADKKAGFEAMVKKKLQKYPGLSHSIITETKHLAVNDVWGKAEILDRTDWMADCFIKIFLSAGAPDSLKTYEDWLKN